MMEREEWPRVAIIVLNWNGWRDTIECLESLYQITYPNYDVIVVDNGSEDESIEKIKDYCEGKINVESKFFKYSTDNKPIKIIEYTIEELEAGGENENEIAFIPFNKKLILIKTNKNYGFAAGNNFGIKYTLNNLNINYILLLNNDTVVGKDFLSELVKVAEIDKNIGIVGPKIYRYKEEGTPGVSGAKIVFWIGGIPKWLKGINQIKYVDMVSGCCMLIKKDVIKIAGMLDPIYFFGWEDADFCMNVKKLGYRVVCNPKGEIWHKIGESYGGYYANNSSILSEGIRNQLIFISRHANHFQKIFSIPFILLHVLFLIFWRSNSINEIRIKMIAIKNGFIDFIKYKLSY